MKHVKFILVLTTDLLFQLNEKFQEQEYENMTKIVQLEKQLAANVKELTTLKVSPTNPFLLSIRQQLVVLFLIRFFIRRQG